MSKKMEAVKTEDLPLDENSIKKGEEDKKKKKRKSPSDDTEQDESEKPKRSKPKLFEPEILEGKREKKIIQRLDLMSKPKEKPKIESTGTGAKLGDIVRINHSIGKLKAPLLKPLHKIVYDRPGTASTLRKNLRLFNGFPFEEESDLYNKKMEKVKRLHKEQLKTICQTLDLERSGTQIVLSEKIMKFLVYPTNSGKPLLKKKKKMTKDAKREKSSFKSKKVESGKSKPIVTDSSSSDDDDDDDDDEEGKEYSKDTEKSVSQKNKDHGDKSSDKEEDDEDDDAPEEDSIKEEKTPPKKSSTTKSTNKPEKAEQTASDESDQDVHEDKNAKKTKKPAAKRKAPAKPVPKTKKADSSSNRGKKKASKSKDESESSDDDQPLIKMIKKPPTEEQLKEAIKDLLKDANLEEVTMKQITRQVYYKYPDFDLTSRKEFIKDTVKGMIS